MTDVFGMVTGFYWAALVAQIIRICCNAGDPSSIPGSGRSPGPWDHKESNMTE